MGYAWNGQCFETAAGALAAFQVDVPSIDGASLLQLGSSSVDGTGLITASVRKAVITGFSPTYSTNTVTHQLNVCSYDSMGSFWTSDIIFLCAMVFAAFVGFKTGFRP